MGEGCKHGTRSSLFYPLGPVVLYVLFSSTFPGSFWEQRNLLLFLIFKYSGALGTNELSCATLQAKSVSKIYHDITWYLPEKNYVPPKKLSNCDKKEEAKVGMTTS